MLSFNNPRITIFCRPVTGGSGLQDLHERPRLFLHVVSVKDCIDKIGKIITVEDHNIINGLGSAVCEVAAEEGKGIVKRIGVQDQFGQSAP